MSKVRFTILEENAAIYPHTRLCSVIYMGTIVTEWETQWVLSINIETGSCGHDWESESEPCGTAILLGCHLSVVVKSLS
jgi:hypothetical protein